MKTSVLITSTCLGLAAAVPAANTPTATTAGPAPSCLYSALPSGTAYAGALYNKNLTASRIDYYYNNYIFTCQVGRNFTAYKLPVANNPWFGAIVYQGSNRCSPGLFAGVLSGAQQDNNQGANTNVTCHPYTGQTGVANGFEANAKKYFKSLK